MPQPFTIDRPTKPTAAELNAAFAMTLAVTEAIREAGEVPLGTLYAMVCGKMDLQEFETMIRAIKNTGLVTETAHLLKWTGPTFQKEAL